jgi:uroporphyrinogen III methyltransferase/synthase
MGAEVEEAVVYRTVKPDGLPEGALERLEGGEIDLITFASSSSVRNFVDLLGVERFGALRDGLAAASIGPITTRTARELGLRVVAEPPEDGVSISGLVAAIVDYCQKDEGES